MARASQKRCCIRSDVILTKEAFQEWLWDDWFSLEEHQALDLKRMLWNGLPSLIFRSMLERREDWKSGVGLSVSLGSWTLWKSKTE